MTTPLLANTVYRHTIFINDLVSGPTQCAVLRRYYQCVFLGVPPATMEDFAVERDNTLSPLYKAIINNNAQYRGSSVARVNGSVPFELDVSSVANVGVGTGGAVAMAKQTAGLVKILTAFRGKRNRGRQYLPFPSTTHDAGNGTPSAAYLVSVANLQAALTALVNIVTFGGRTAQLIPVIWAPRAPGTVQPITSSFASGRWATQRRRGDFGRVNVSPI